MSHFRLKLSFVALPSAVLVAAIMSGCFYNPKTMREVSILDAAFPSRCPMGEVFSYLAGYRCEGLTESPITTKNANEKVPGTGKCALFFAIRSSNDRMIDELIAKGAKPASCNGYPTLIERAVHPFCASNPYPVEPLLMHLEKIGIIGPDSATELLHVSARNVCMPGLKQAIRLGADPNSQVAGRTALHSVLSSASDPVIESVAFLIAAGANPNIPDSIARKTALEVAANRFEASGNWPRLRSALLSRQGNN